MLRQRTAGTRRKVRILQIAVDKNNPNKMYEFKYTAGWERFG